MKGASVSTQTGDAPKDLVGFLDFYLVRRAPFQLPPAAREFLVQWGPWITIVLLILTVPPLLFVLGIGTLLIPFGGVRYAQGFGVAMLLLIIQLALMIAALPGLFARRTQGWTMLFYAELVSIVAGLLSGSIVGALLGGLIGLYLLFQIRLLYH
jgi:hypothetical protein